MLESSVRLEHAQQRQLARGGHVIGRQPRRKQRELAILFRFDSIRFFIIYICVLFVLFRFNSLNYICGGD